MNDTGQDVAVEAGPNGPENVRALPARSSYSYWELVLIPIMQNHDLNFAFSPDLGETWENNWNQTVANMTAEEPIVPVSAGIVIFGIPKYG